MLVKNKLLKWVDDQTIERVLWIDPTKTDVATIEVTYDLALPVWRKLFDLEAAIEANLLQVLEVDDYAPRVISETELATDRYKIYQEKRDKWFKAIEPFTHGEEAVKLFFPSERAALVAERAIETAISEASIYKYIRRWWQGGQILAALTPHFLNGGRRSDGKPKKIDKKRGRPSIISLNDPDKRPTGVNVDDYWRGIIIEGGELFWEYRKSQNWHNAYIKTLRLICPKAKLIVGGKEKTILPDSNKGEVFTKGQFKYHYSKYLRSERNLKRAIIKALGLKKFNLRHRRLKGNAKEQATYPGALYQIDATLADVNLVSAFHPTHHIGRPWIYAIIDVFSRMVVGLAVRLEGEGWLGVRLALENVVANKVSFCARYCIEITEEIWPNCYLSEEITGDRGPLVGKQADNIPKGLGVRISNCAPCRADWKGVIEQFFHRLNILVFHALPGAVEAKREWGDRDTRLDAALTIHDLTEAMIAVALFYNTKHEMDWYPLDKDMIADGVRPIPLELYKWGLENRGGTLTEHNIEHVRVNLLPEREASITELGIMCGARDQLYTCELFEREGWDFLAREQGRSSIIVGYDPRLTEPIYYSPGGGRPRIPCFLKDPESLYKGKDWREVEELIKQQRLNKALFAPGKIQAHSELEEDLDRIVTRAKKRKREAALDTPKLSKSAQLKGIRVHRQAELEAMQRAEADEIRKAVGLTVSESNLPDDMTDELPVPIHQPDNVREIRRRMMKNEEKD